MKTADDADKDDDLFDFEQIEEDGVRCLHALRHCIHLYAPHPLLSPIRVCQYSYQLDGDPNFDSAENKRRREAIKQVGVSLVIGRKKNKKGDVDVGFVTKVIPFL